MPGGIENALVNGNYPRSLNELQMCIHFDFFFFFFSFFTNVQVNEDQVSDDMKPGQK